MNYQWFSIKKHFSESLIFLDCIFSCNLHSKLNFLLCRIKKLAVSLTTIHKYPHAKGISRGRGDASTTLKFDNK